jgi:Cu-Zn family superoxide dismutase
MFRYYKEYMNDYFTPLKTHIIAVVNLNENNIRGNVMFHQIGDNDVFIDINISGLPINSKLGFHIHEAGDLTEGCKSTCKHFNPYNQIHGGPDSTNRHVGDLGNIITDNTGKCIMKLYDNMIKLNGSTQNIMGRSIVIHENTDDLGLGNNMESFKTGNAGKRIACGIIGYSKKMFD